MWTPDIGNKIYTSDTKPTSHALSILALLMGRGEGGGGVREEGGAVNINIKTQNSSFIHFNEWL